jgi:hypothetical protein
MSDDGSTVKRRSRSPWVITGGIVPPGTLEPNHRHPLAHLTPEERVEGIYSALGHLVLRLIEMDRAQAPSPDPSPPSAVDTIADQRGTETMKKTATEKKTEALLAAAFRKLPKRITCPKCKKTKARDAFGLRVMARDAKGVPTSIARQSYCGKCRAR